jgi:hypothetical protein
MLTSFQQKKATRFCVSLVTLPAILMVTLAWTAIDEELEQLKLNYAAFQVAVKDFRKQRELNGLDGTGAEDYAAYIAGLQRRVFEDCQAVILSGSPFPEDLPCPVIVPPVTQSADIATQSEQTPEEMIAALDASLKQGMGEYDEKLLREQERIKAATPNDNSASGGGIGGGSGEGGSGAEGNSGDSGDSGGMNDGSEGGNQGVEGDGGRPAGGPADSSIGSGEAGNDSDQPEDIPDGSDDDVVARQLREAAEKENDPELKAKLWEEYRRYKLGTGG